MLCRIYVITIGLFIGRRRLATDDPVARCVKMAERNEILITVETKAHCIRRGSWSPYGEVRGFDTAFSLTYNEPGM